MGAVIERWKRSQLYEWLRLKGYVAFNLPRTVSMLGAALLIGIAAAHVYVLTSQPALPMYFVVYAAILEACCLLAAASLWLGRNPRVPQLGWFFGDLVSVVFLGVYLASRAATSARAGGGDRPVGFRTRHVRGRVRAGLYRRAHVGAAGHQRGLSATAAVVRLTGTSAMTTFDYPVWLRVDHWLNVLFVTLIIRSGIEILATHPKLYWNDDSRPGSEWARFTRKVMPKNKLYDTLDEEEDYSPFISLPGHAQLGIGRHWHFFAVIGWILVGLSYYILLFATGQWHRYWPALVVDLPRGVGTTSSPT